jgi:hypothetical protein
MLGYLDPILFPDECEVVELSPGHYVYPIFKNGSSGIRDRATRFLTPDGIGQIDHVDVYVRDPFERYVSGVQTYLRQNTHLDRNTALTMIDQYLFLNRHFSLQFHWLMNLQRYNDSAWITFRSMAELDNTVGETWNALTRDQTLVDYFQSNKKLHYYLQLDTVLAYDFMGKTVQFNHIVDHIKIKYPDLYKETIERVKHLCAVLV